MRSLYTEHMSLKLQEIALRAPPLVLYIRKDQAFSASKGVWRSSQMRSSNFKDIGWGGKATL